MNASIIATRTLCVISLVLLTACGGSDGGTTVTNTTVVSPVAVSTVFPTEACPSETIMVRGQQFGATQGTNTLSINGVTATQITSWSDTQIEAIVPVRATTGNCFSLWKKDTTAWMPEVEPRRGNCRG